MLRSEKLRMLFVGDDWYGSNATSLRNGFIQRGIDVTTVNTFDLASARAHLHRRAIKKLSPRAYEEAASARVSRAITRALESRQRFDVLFVFKGDFIDEEVVAGFDGIRVHYHPDDSGNAENTSRRYLTAESHYDLHVTTKVHNVAELQSRTDARVLFVQCAYDPAWHTPQSFASASRVGLIGTRRPDRTQFVEDCARRTAQKMLIAGSGWKLEPALVRSAEVHGPKFGLEFSKYAAQAPIQLGVLNSANRDTHTCRTFEIPAAGALFVGEWTAEHADIFSSPNSAMLYRSSEEALEMLAFAEANPSFVDKARRRGYDHIISGSNTYADRASRLLDAISEFV